MKSKKSKKPKTPKNPENPENPYSNYYTLVTLSDDREQKVISEVKVPLPDHPRLEPNVWVGQELAAWAFNPTDGGKGIEPSYYQTSSSANAPGAVDVVSGFGHPDATYGGPAYNVMIDKAALLFSLKEIKEKLRAEERGGRNDAVIYSPNRDPYLIIPHPDVKTERMRNAIIESNTQRVLKAIRDESDLSVYLLTTSVRAKFSFKLFSTFGSRFHFGVDIPIRSDHFVWMAEPGTLAPSKRMQLLLDALKAGLNIFAVVPTEYPGLTEQELDETARELRNLGIPRIVRENLNTWKNDANIHIAHNKEALMQIGRSHRETPNPEFTK